MVPLFEFLVGKIRLGEVFRPGLKKSLVQEIGKNPEYLGPKVKELIDHPRHSIYIRTVSSWLLLFSGIFVSFLAGLA